MPTMKLAAFAALASSVAALPAYSNTTTTYACNPAHQYPNGASCISTAGSLTLVTPAPVAATTYACNPAHQYPGASCISTAGTLSLVKNNATATPAGAAKTSYVTEVVTALTTFCPESTQLTHNGVTYTVSSATTLTITDCPCTITHTSVVGPTTSAPVAVPTYACNPAHSYPNGAKCISTAGTLSLVTLTASAAVSSAPVSSTQAATYACNPAHSYPNGASCISTAGTLSLVTPAASVPVSSAPSSSAPAVTYACNPAHSYPNGAKCVSTAGTLSLVTPVPAQSTAVVPSPAVSTAVVPAPAQSTPIVPAPAQSSAAICPPPAAPVTVTVTATVTVNSAAATTPAPVPSAPATTYACNPAHSYPGGVQCISSGTGLTLVTPTALTTTSYACTTSAGGVSCSPVSTGVVSTSTKAITLTSTSTKAASTSIVTKASSSAPAANSTTSVSTTPVAPLNTASATACPLNLPTDYQYPHLLEINGVNGYFGQVDATSNTTFSFDIPQSYSGKTCNTYFALPAKSKLVTSDYTLSVAKDGAKIYFESEGKTLTSFSPNPVDQKWLVKSEDCQAGKAVTYEMFADAGVSLRWFQDWNACALGLFVVPE